ncbi:MAG: preprotein translocase subunit SecE [Gammaproteobacteria bacterium RIFOXYA12_FULL_61_12]|nr:MAG: preprotein translocase subunit SecE [Gammaproteobacteria bacterium RIFOXYD12_FULL_61_37]OGT90461.1 MAG: preprotein translocase subunit SecE [Gammaproteobacteria bacterium RIFOXYA12_FULL_61_12]
MNAKADTPASAMDSVKLIASLLALLAGIWAFYHFGEESVLLRVLGLLAVVALSVWIALQTDAGRGIWSFATESRVEVRKVVWPTRQETLQTTLVVFIMVFLLGLFLWLVDMLLAAILRAITG